MLISMHVHIIYMYVFYVIELRVNDKNKKLKYLFFIFFILSLLLCLLSLSRACIKSREWNIINYLVYIQCIEKRN